MLASDLQVSLPLVTGSTSLAMAARLIAHRHLPLLVATDDDGNPVAMITSASVLGMLIEHGETIADALGTERAGPLPHVSASAPLSEVCSAMLASGAEIAVVDGASDPPRFVMLADLIDAVLVELDDGLEIR